MEKKPEEGEGKILEVIDVDVTNIAGISRMTRSDRIYTLDFKVTNEAFQGPAKEAMAAVSREELDLVKPYPTNEFLKLIKKSDYKVVDQLHQAPSKISILPILLNS